MARRSKRVRLVTRRAGVADIDAVTDTIATAFYNDPVWSWAFPDPQRRAAQLIVWWGFWVDTAVRSGEVWMTESCEAATVWIPPGGAECTPEEEELVAPMLHGLLGAHAEHVIETLDRFDANHPHDVPHHYLSLVGTHPDHRGKGLGVALIADYLARVDAEHLPAYLESSNPDNHARYERLGFEPTGEFELPGSAPPVLTMWRPAR